MAIGVSDGLS